MVSLASTANGLLLRVIAFVGPMSISIASDTAEIPRWPALYAPPPRLLLAVVFSVIRLIFAARFEGNGAGSGAGSGRQLHVDCGDVV